MWGPSSDVAMSKTDESLKDVFVWLYMVITINNNVSESNLCDLWNYCRR